MASLIAVLLTPIASARSISLGMASPGSKFSLRKNSSNCLSILSTWDNALAGFSLEIGILVLGLNNQCLFSTLKMARIIYVKKC
jgi:hypothetical protein